MRPNLSLLIAVSMAACTPAQIDRPSAITSALPTLAPWNAPAEYRRVFIARGIDPDWEGQVGPGEARLRIEGGAEITVPLRAPGPCIAKRCEGVMIEQRVSHRHHGASIIKMPCRLPGSETEYSYLITISVLRSPFDREGVNYKGCGRPVGAGY